MTPKDPQNPPKEAANLVKGHSVGACSPGADAKSAVEVEAEAAEENDGVVFDREDLDAEAAFRTEAPPLGGNFETK